jgi:hypothetical protein
MSVLIVVIRADALIFLRQPLSTIQQSYMSFLFEL